MKKCSSSSVRLEETSFSHVYISLLEKILKHKEIDRGIKYTRNERESKWFLIYSLIYRNDKEYHVPIAVYRYLVIKAKQKFKYLS
jgi:hypothetical protein